eukprot:tig00021318_g20167.t1
MVGTTRGLVQFCLQSLQALFHRLSERRELLFVDEVIVGHDGEVIRRARRVEHRIDAPCRGDSVVGRRIQQAVVQHEFRRLDRRVPGFVVVRWRGPRCLRWRAVAGNKVPRSVPHHARSGIWDWTKLP